jgi:hypothetical protein
MAHPLAEPSWHGRLGRALADLQDNRRAVIHLAWPFYAGAVLSWLLFLPLAWFWSWPAWLQLATLEVLWFGAGATTALRMSRRVGLGEPLIRDDFRVYARALLAYAKRLAVVVVVLLGMLAIATTLAGPLPPPMRTGAFVVIGLAAIWAAGRLHLYLAAIAMDRPDLGLRAAWRLDTGRAAPVTMGILALYVPLVGLDAALVAGRDGLGFLTGTAVTLAAATLSAALTAARASFFARLLLSLDT